MESISLLLSLPNLNQAALIELKIPKIYRVNIDEVDKSISFHLKGSSAISLSKKFGNLVTC